MSLNGDFAATLVLIASILVSRRVGTRGIRRLAGEERDRLAAVLAKMRPVSFFFLLFFLSVFIAVTLFSPVSPARAVVLYSFLALSYLAAVSLYGYGKLKKGSFAPAYRRSYLLSLLVRWAGIAVFFFIYLF